MQVETGEGKIIWRESDCSSECESFYYPWVYCRKWGASHVCIFLQGETVRTDVITSIDPLAEKIGSDDADFVISKTKAISHGFKGIEVPYMVT